MKRRVIKRITHLTPVSCEVHIEELVTVWDAVVIKCDIGDVKATPHNVPFIRLRIKIIYAVLLNKNPEMHQKHSEFKQNCFTFILFVISII